MQFATSCNSEWKANLFQHNGVQEELKKKVLRDVCFYSKRPKSQDRGLFKTIMATKPDKNKTKILLQKLKKRAKLKACKSTHILFPNIHFKETK